MKILILQDEFFPNAKGGAAIVVFDLAKSFYSHGHEVSVITATQDKNLVGRSNLNGINVYRIFSNYSEKWRAYTSLYNYQTVGQISRILNEVKPDIVHAHNIHLHISYHALKLAQKSGAKVFLTAHDAMLYEYGKASDESKVSWMKQLKENKFRYNPLRNLIINRYLLYVDKIIAVSHSLQRALGNNHIRNVTVIYNGTNLNDWVTSAESVQDFKRRHRLENKKVITIVGRLSGLKGGQNMVEVLASIIKKIPTAVLLIACKQGSYDQLMKSVAQSLNIGEHLVFTGWLEHNEMAAAYFASDVVTFPSLYSDPFGMVNIEAMACSKPVVTTCFGGASEIVVDGETGYVVDPNDTNSVAEKVSELLIDEQKARQFGKAGQERVQKLFTLQNQAGNYLKLFTAV